MKIIHTSDLHLNSKMESSLTSEQAKQRKAELLRTFARMIDYANENGVEAIIIAGDMFDTETINKSTKEYVLDIIKKNSNITFLYLCGNHEKTAFIESIDIPTNLLTFEDTWTYHSLSDGIVVAGTNITKQNHKSMYSNLKLKDIDTNIVVLHGQVSKYFLKDNFEIVNITELRNKNIDYLALGHIHSYQIDDLDDHAKYCYPGCLEGRGFDECGEHGFVVLDITNKSVTHTFIPIAKRKLHTIEVDISHMDNTSMVDNAINLKIKDISKDDLLKIVLVGKVSKDNNINIELLNTALNELYYFAKIVNNTSLDISIEDYKNDTSIKGEFIRKVLSSNLSAKEQESVILTGLKAFDGEVEL